VAARRQTGVRVATWQREQRQGILASNQTQSEINAYQANWTLVRHGYK